MAFWDHLAPVVRTRKFNFKKWIFGTPQCSHNQGYRSYAFVWVGLTWVLIWATPHLLYTQRRFARNQQDREGANVAISGYLLCCEHVWFDLVWTSMVWFKGKLCFDQILDKTFTGGANQSSLPPSSLPTSGLHQHTDILLISRLETFLQEEKRRNKKINQNHLLYSYWTFKVNIWKGVPGVFVCGPLAFRPWDRLVYIRGRASTVRHATFRFSVTFFERKN